MTAGWNSRIIAAWEHGQASAGTQRALLLMSLVVADADPAALSLGERNRQLLILLRGLQGPRLDAELACPRCNQRLELELDADALLALPHAAGQVEVQTKDGPVTARVPTSADLLALRAVPAEALANALFARCVGGPGRQLALQDTGLQAELNDALATSDPLAELSLAVTCADCAHQWDAMFDPSVFAWSSVEQRARSLLREVHTISRAYGWREDEILELSEPRRRRYLELILGIT